MDLCFANFLKSLDIDTDGYRHLGTGGEGVAYVNKDKVLKVIGEMTTPVQKLYAEATYYKYDQMRKADDSCTLKVYSNHMVSIDAGVATITDTDGSQQHMELKCCCAGEYHKIHTMTYNIIVMEYLDELGTYEEYIHSLSYGRNALYYEKPLAEIPANLHKFDEYKEPIARLLSFYENHSTHLREFRLDLYSTNVGKRKDGTIIAFDPMSKETMRYFRMIHCGRS